LDPHYKDGSHWVALAIDLKRTCVYYFDSYGMAPPDQVARFMKYLTLQEPKLRLESNGRRFQYSHTECGMYSMYFIIRMIAGASFKKFCKHPISDKWMLEFRKVLFDANASP
jgi:Ulp1 family protease